MARLRVDVTPVVERYLVDGVPLLRSPGIDGRHMAALTFRVGRFDETLPISGITHLVEHLTLSGAHQVRYPFNGSVSGRFTTFVMESGDPADVARFIVGVCRGLTADQGPLLDRERRILRTEAASRGGAGAMGTCLAERFGATGPGLVNYDEYGLHHLGWGQVAAWRRQWFTAGNAVLLVAGDIPDTLRVELPPGQAMHRQPLWPLPRALPGYLHAARSGIGVSLVGDRGPASRAAVSILQRRLTQVLRHEQGISYDVHATSEDLDRDLVHTWLAADALPEQAAVAAHVMMSVFEALAGSGCTSGELVDHARREWEALQSPGSAVLALQRRARDILNGRPERDAEQDLSMASSLQPKDIAETVTALYGSMIVAVPGLLPAIQGRMRQLPIGSDRTISGARQQAVDSAAVLTIGADGVMLTEDGCPSVTVAFRDVAALIRWNDGKHALVGLDGYAIQLDPAQWPNGSAVLASVARRVPQGAIVHVDAPAPRRAPRPTVAPARLRRRPSLLGRFLLLFCAGILALSVLSTLGGDISGGLTAGLTAASVIGLYEYWLRRPYRRQ